MGKAETLRALREQNFLTGRKHTHEPLIPPHAELPKVKPMPGKVDKVKKKSTKPIARKTPVKKSGKKIKARTKERARDERVYAKIRGPYLEQHPECAIKGPTCTGKATEINHRKGRRGKQLLNVKDFEPSCHNCNQHVEKHPELHDFAHKQQQNTEKPNK